MDVDTSINPIVAHVDYSPTSDPPSSQDFYDQVCYACLYAIVPDQYLDSFNNTFLDGPNSDCSVSSTKFPVSLEYASALQPSLPSSQLELDLASRVDITSVLRPSVPSTPVTATSSGRLSHENDAFAAPVLSASSSRCETPYNATSLVDEPIQKRRRGRPRLHCKLSDSYEISSPKLLQRTSCVSHNQVERKYREGLVSELERLRRVVPELSQSNEGAVIGRPGPTKTMVLSCAIAYIRKLEMEKDELREENQQLGGNMWKEMGGQSEP
jgi:hypothetical protein